jgi:type I site-specific restriction endonuclease
LVQIQFTQQFVQIQPIQSRTRLLTSGHPARVLITQATGTGKTKVAFQIVWKLKHVREVKNVLFITDRDWLLTQAMDNEFAPFRDARARIRGELRTAQDIFFATYQALAGAEGRGALYQRYPRNYFDLIIIDECHRGSSDEESSWRTILDYFTDAVQIGMTATPLRSDNVDTYNYFGQPVAVYSLRQGINDGFLAPYRVRRVLMRGVDELEGRRLATRLRLPHCRRRSAGNCRLPWRPLPRSSVTRMTLQATSRATCDPQTRSPRPSSSV